MTLETQWVHYGKNKEHIGYMAKMERANENLPAVIVIQEIWGFQQFPKKCLFIDKQVLL